MAEEDRGWRQNHAHESNEVSYGTFGTASYHSAAQQWMFLRHESSVRVQDDRESVEEDTVPLLRIFPGPKTLAEPNCENKISRHTTIDSTLYSRFCELAAAPTSIQGISQSEAGINSIPTVGHTVSFGCAVWLSADGADSGNLTVPTSAHVSGPGRDLLHIACIGRQSFDHVSEDGVRLLVKIPSLSGDPQTFWTCNTPIQQVLFVQQDLGGRAGTFLAVRQASQTNIFEPLLRRDNYASSLSARRSSLDSNMLLVLPRSRTGGQDHSDVSFHPSNQRKLAVVDVGGNWSIWHVQGRRTHTARRLYKMVLQSSSKMFSWENKRRPKGIELYFDGWHKLLWISCNADGVNRLLVCNRHDAKLFDIKGTNRDEVSSVDVRLDTQKEDAFMLDVKAGPTPNVCFILTTSRLLLFDFAQTEWKDSGSARGPALLCTWQHFQHASDLSLRVSTLVLGATTLLALYSSNSTIVQLYPMHFTSIDDKLCVEADDPSPCYLPEGTPDSPIASLSLASLESSEHEHVSGRRQTQLLYIIVQHENLAVTTITAGLSIGERSHSIKQQPTLRLPPNRSMQRKSERFVNELEDEDDLAGFIVDDEGIEESEYGADVPDSEQDRMPDAADRKESQNELGNVVRLVTPKKFHEDAMVSVFNEATNEPPPRRDILKALELLDQRLQDISASQENSPAILLSELFVEDLRIEDIETDSATLERALHMIGSAVQERLQISISKNEYSRPLLQIYEDVFRQYVSSLNTAVPDRFRVERERQARNVALDLYLLSRTVRRLPSPNNVQMNDSETLPEDDPMIFSDPILRQDDASQTTRAQLSASQPVLRLPSSPPPLTPAMKLSPLEDAMARLSSYTAISRPPAQDLPSTASTHISSLLFHLPESADADPDTYDYQATELNIAASNDTSKGKLPSKADQKSERLARARKTAHENPHRQSHIRDTEMAISSMTLGDAHDIRPHQSEMQIGPQPRYITSEGNEAPQSSSQGAATGMPATQPVSGAHTNRAAVKKKKKRVAGF